MSKPPCFVAEINLELAKKLRTDLIEQGFEISNPEYTIFQAKKIGISCTLYSSGKITVQGKDKDEFIAFYLEPEILKNVSYSYPESTLDTRAHIGVDESGKGDVFGPLCICSFYADTNGIQALIKMGIKDSKKLQDTTILALAEKLEKNFSYHIIQIFPKKYNQLYESFNNLNHLLAWGHATAIENLVEKTGCKEIIIDQFANEAVVINALRKKSLEVNLTQRHRGEEDVVVAAASILARAAFLRGLERLTKQFQIRLPKGASSIVIKVGRELVRTHGKGVLEEVSKLHFKTIQEILGCGST